MSTETLDIAIIGAGPYGLSTAAHLLAARPGARLRIFGEPMSFWDTHMPVGMFLRSPWVASNLSDPRGELTLDTYKAESGLQFGSPVPLDQFVAYGRWFQRRAVPEVDQRQVTRVESGAGSFRLTLDDDSEVLARQLVVAAGIAAFPRVPEPFRELTPDLVSHSSEHRDLGRFAGKRVMVVGAGQSALESAALLHEAGAETELLVRAPFVRWLHAGATRHRWPIGPLLYAPPDVGPAGLSQIVARPGLFRRLPRRWQDKWDPRSVRPAGANWLKPRLESVPIHTQRAVASAARSDGHVRLQLDDGTARDLDHVMLGTGYRVELSRYAFLAPSLLSSIRTVSGYPVLNPGFEASVPGLHFVGAPAAWSFGPLMRFVAGADFASRAVARHLRGR